MRTERAEFSVATKKARNEHCRDENGDIRCETCGAITGTEANPADHDHYNEDASGGDNSFENCRVVCRKTCHKKKTAEFKTACAKADRSKARAEGTRREKQKIPSRGFQRRWA
jgi:hypothetical protein